MSQAETRPRGRASLWRRLAGFRDSLAGRLLALTVVAVIAGEMFIFAPALARFHEDWLLERMNLAQVAALALEGSSAEYEIADTLQDELLSRAGVQRAALEREGERVLLLEDPDAMPTLPLIVYDYTTSHALQRGAWALESLFAPDGRTLRVLMRPRFESADFVEIVLDETPLKRDMEAFARGFLILSTLILMAAGALIYLVISMVFVAPMQDLTRAIERFREKPEDVSIAFPRSARGDEIGRAQRAAADMAEQVRNALRQKERLAALGGAVARIGHDLRNMLSTAQLVADRLVDSEDPNVRRLAPRLERTIARAVGLAASTLKYGRADERAPVLQRVEVAAAAEDAAGDALVGFESVVQFRADIEKGLGCIADPENLHRVLVNLMRNAAQAMQAHPSEDRRLILRAVRVEGRCEIEVIDHGPGVDEKMHGRLFEPFASAAPEAGGTGLGLAISRELARAMGGELELTRTGAAGATFRITLPAA